MYHIDWDAVAEALGLGGKNPRHAARMRFLRFRSERGDAPAKTRVKKSAEVPSTTEDATSGKVEDQASAKKRVARTEGTRQTKEEINEDEDEEDGEEDEKEDNEPIIQRRARRRGASEAFPSPSSARADESPRPSNTRAKKSTGKSATVSISKRIEGKYRNPGQEDSLDGKSVAKLQKSAAGVREKKGVQDSSDKADGKVDEAEGEVYEGVSTRRSFQP